MTDLAFTIFIAGCAHGATDCVELDRFEMTAESRAACELVLDQRLALEQSEHPEYVGLCLSGTEQIVQAPAWWPLSSSLAGL